MGDPVLVDRLSRARRQVDVEPAGTKSPGTDGETPVGDLGTAVARRQLASLPAIAVRARDRHGHEQCCRPDSPPHVATVAAKRGAPTGPPSLRAAERYGLAAE